MPFYRVGLNQDAYIHHSCVVEADSPEEAQLAPADQWKGRRDDLVIVPSGVSGYDWVDTVELDDIEEIDEDEYNEELAQNQRAAGPTRPAIDIFKGFQAEAGWTEDTMLALLAEFIDCQGDGLDKMLIDFLAGKLPKE